ncbi:MAG: sulfatase [Bryobacterales bacterium]|nr:sulfatase [Bryobacterales bacterium]
MMNRRSFLHSILGASALGATACATTERDQSLPNIVLIYADDLGFGDLSCYGAQAHKTPRLDQLAAEGVRFTHFYVPTPYCAPSRCSLLTGRYPFRSGMVFNPAPDAGINEVGLPAEELTIAELLKTKGYATTCIGKWHLGHTEKFLPRTQGFDEYFGILYSNDMRPVQIVENERVAIYPVNQTTITRDYTNRAIQFIERNQTKPFLLYLPHAMPHKPLAASEEFYSPETAEDLYSDVVRELDYECGRIFDTLKRLDLGDNTLVIFASDNGPWFGGNTAGLRGMKASSFEGGIRVPFIARWPGKIPAGRTCDEIAGVIDVLPTICGVTNIPVPDDRTMDGRDIWPLMTEADAKSPHEAIFSMSGANLATVRSGQWKLHVRQPALGPAYMDERVATGWVDPRGPDGVTLLAQFEQSNPSHYPGLRGGDGAVEMMLFDLAADPGEQKNVAAQNPQVVERLKTMFDKLNTEVPEIRREERHGGGGVRRLTGGKPGDPLVYDQMPQHPEGY